MQRILESAIWAASAHNRQAWHFVVLSSRSTREQLVDEMENAFRQDLSRNGYTEEPAARAAARSRQRILGAPVTILFCLDTSLPDIFYIPARQQPMLRGSAERGCVRPCLSNKSAVRSWGFRESGRGRP